MISFPRRRAARLSVSTVAMAACLGTGIGEALAPSFAHAVDVVPRGTSDRVQITGHGHGHGRGMSQWGAYGAASVSGLNYRQILDFYYPGTSRRDLPDDTIRVSLDDAVGDTTVAPASGLQLVTAAGKTALPTGASYQRWRVRGGAAIRLEHQDQKGAWRPYVPVGLVLRHDVAFRSANGVVAVMLPGGAWKEVRGDLHATLVEGKVRTVLHTPMETYLRGVVPSEMPASWHHQALAAQAVAARTYAAAYRQRQREAGAWYDICGSSTCQVYAGVAERTGGTRTTREDSRSDAAITQTAGVVLRAGSGTNAPLVNAEFSASNGGWTAAGPLPYQVAKQDPYDGMLKSSPNTWVSTVSMARLDGVKGIGTFRRVVILTREGRGDLGGPILTARLEGSARSVEVTGEELRVLWGLRSAWFTVTGAGTASVRDWNGDGKADVLARDEQGRLSLFPGNGSGIGEGTQVGHGWAEMKDMIAVGDWDGDDRPDMIARTPEGRLVRYSGDGKGGFGPARQIGQGWNGYRGFISPGDWDGDGRPDLIAIDIATERLVLIPGLGDTLGAPVPLGERWASVTQLVAPGDFDGDGRPDIIGITTGGEMFLRSGNGKGGLSAPRRIGHGWKNMRAVWSIGDADDDGRADVMALDRSGTLRRYSGNGQGGFPKTTIVGQGWKGRSPVS
ncbi:hypothetical protein KEM60_02998 [Austwickia sp. TVS 96-490-7B]|uniref:SpoIID/LytB domain-containing protein n=1 Tax=Austwickia sp. TVS 96-490-7B TaxID=2830843 RepID=UPI001C59FBD4|nr:SpoIID/LytB domain-containing protein [Austwickia sp. TVS 96-490-7B]MBW3086769.1 hypothetical protein [Austwickia sp. TVS 96-490-7B]